MSLNHSICYECWNHYEQGNETQHDAPRELGWGVPDFCCWCTKFHCSGIYLRRESGFLRCDGDHRLRLVQNEVKDIVFRYVEEEE